MADALQAVRGEGITALIVGNRNGPPVGVAFSWVERSLTALSRERRIVHAIVLGKMGVAGRAGSWARHDAQIPCTQFPERMTQRDRMAQHHEVLDVLVQLTEAARRLVLWFPPDDIESAHVVATAGLRSVPVWRCSLAGRWEVGP